VIKEIALQISVKHIRANDMVFQRFSILGSKRDYRYLLDPRFYTKKVFDHEILKRSLADKKGYEFCDRIEIDNGIEVRYADDSGDPLDDHFFTIHDFVPSTFGCEYCEFLDDEYMVIHHTGHPEETDLIMCDFFRKPTKIRKGSCKYFDQRRLFKT